MPIVRAHAREPILSGVGDATVVNTLRCHKVSNAYPPDQQSVADSQPPKPPFPVVRRRPFQLSGSQISATTPDLSDVAICRATRQRSTGTTWLFPLQVGSLSGRLRLVPDAMKACSVTVAFVMPTLAGSNDAHCCWKVAGAGSQTAPRLKAARTSRATKAMAGATMVSKQAQPRNRFTRGGHEPCDIVPAVLAPIHTGQGQRWPGLLVDDALCDVPQRPRSRDKRKPLVKLVAGMAKAGKS